MPYYRKKPIAIQATQWFKPGDHFAVFECDRETFERLVFDRRECETDEKPWLYMGVCGVEEKHLVYPGDYVVTGVQDEIYSVRQNIFEETYDEIVSWMSQKIENDKEEIDYQSRSFSGIDQIAMDLYVAASGLPHDQLYGESSFGLGATKERNE